MLCTLDRTIYEDRSSGFSIVSFKTKDEAVPAPARSTYYHGDKLIRFTAIGYHLPTTSAIDVDVDGVWENGKHGLQLNVRQCTEIIPKTKDGISNGDVGFVTNVYLGEDNDSAVTVSFGAGRSHEYGTDETDMLELAYAMTIHKSQGSEYDTVILPMMAGYFIMLRRNLIYTAITRAKKKVIIVGEKKAIYMAIHKNDIDGRNTRLADQILRIRREQK